MNKIIEKKDESYAGTVVLRCDDRCCSLVVDKFQDDEGISYNLSIQDSNYKSNTGFVSRFKRAVKTFFEKPIYYNDIYLQQEDQMKEFVESLNNLVYK